MGRSGNIGWGVSTYFKLPNKKRNLLTKEFLQTFKEELIKIFSENDKKNNRNIDYENETYYGFYGQIESTGGFYESLKNACEKHNLIKAIYEYELKMPWYDSDCFDDDLMLEMVHKGIIKKDRPEDYISDYDIEKYETAKYKLVKYYKGYNVVKYGTWFDDDREGLEEIYKDSEQELIWLN
jgi:hypothetical protein